MTADQCRTFYYPVARFLFFEPAFIANKIFYLSPLIFAGCDTIYFFTTVPECHFSGTFRTIAVRILWFQKPDSVLKAEGFISECAYRTNINYISDKITFKGFMNICCDFRMIATVKNPVFAPGRQLIGYKYTPVAEYAACHM